MGVRATAVRAAAAVHAEREAAFAAREKQIRELVTGFFVAHGQVEQVLAAANERCRQIMAAAAAAAGQAQSEAAGAVAGLQALGLSRQELAQVTRLKAGQVRALLAAARTQDPPERAAVPGRGEVPVAGNSQDAGAAAAPGGAGDPDHTRARPSLVGDGDPPGADDVSADRTSTPGVTSTGHGTGPAPLP